MRLRVCRAVAVVSLLLLCLSAAARAQNQTAAPWPIRAVIIATFEVGADTGDTPGEYQLWVEREHLDEVLPSPGGYHPLRTNREHTVLAMLSGTTINNATASMMALGLDPRFDLSHAYILINGIAGIDPHAGSMGSAAWARFVVGDVAREIDPRDAPKNWPYGIFPTTAHEPNPPDLTDSQWNRTNLFKLNAGLAQWAYAQTKDLDLGDDPKVATFRAQYTGMPMAQRKPFVLMGDTFASDYYWHGPTMTRYAEDWVKLWTRGQGTFATTEMEDSGFLLAVERLSLPGTPLSPPATTDPLLRAPRLDPMRVMVLRTGSNYCTPPPGHTAIESVTMPYIGGRLALESAYKVGSAVLHRLLADWPQTRDHIPAL